MSTTNCVRNKFALCAKKKRKSSDHICPPPNRFANGHSFVFISGHSAISPNYGADLSVHIPIYTSNANISAVQASGVLHVCMCARCGILSQYVCYIRCVVEHDWPLLSHWADVCGGGAREVTPTPFVVLFVYGCSQYVCIDHVCCGGIYSTYTSYVEKVGLYLGTLFLVNVR